MNLWFVAPALGRFDLSEITMRQWAALQDGFDLGDELNLEVVVIADDDNLDIARRHGFHTVERDNSSLGGRYNDGFEYAYDHGADFAGESGTKNLIHPDLLKAMPWTPGRAQSGNLYSLVAGNQVETFYCGNVFGRGPLFLPRELLDYHRRPVDENETTLILHSICERTSPSIEFTNVHDFQYVGFLRDGDPYITSREDYRNRWGVLRTHPKGVLSEWF